MPDRTGDRHPLRREPGWNWVSRGMLLLALAITGTGPVLAASIEAGVSRVEITPPVGYPMGGYQARLGPSTGVRDPLYATVLWLAAEGKRVAIVSCDLRSFPSDRVVEQARAKGLADHVLIVSTHTHSGPITWEDRTWPRPDRSWFSETEEKILQAIAEAVSHRFPARLAAGSGSIYLGHNRRQVEGIGKVTMRWRNEERLPTAPLDPTVQVLRIDGEAGTPRVLLVNYACHAVVLGPDNRQISADYPGALRRHLEAALPGVTALFLPGAGGDINPYLDKQPITQRGFEEMERMGRSLGEEVLRVARRLRPAAPVGEAPLRVTADVLPFRDRWDPRKEWRVGLTTLVLDRTIALTAIPGEPFVELQIAWRDRLRWSDHPSLSAWLRLQRGRRRLDWIRSNPPGGDRRGVRSQHQHLPRSGGWRGTHRPGGRPRLPAPWVPSGRSSPIECSGRNLNCLTGGLSPWGKCEPILHKE